MKFVKLIAVAALVWSPVAFSATNLGAVGSSATKFNGVLNTLGYIDYTFTISGTGKGTLGGSTSSSFLPPLDLKLFSGSNPSSLAFPMYLDTSTSSFSFANLSAGTYTLRADFGSGSFSGSMSVSGMAAPVPEAENIAMLLVGLSGVGFIGLRRRRRD